MNARERPARTAKRRQPVRPTRRPADPFNESARQWFRGIPPDGQVLVLQMIATLKGWTLGRDALPVAALLATGEQRGAFVVMQRERQRQAAVTRQKGGAR